MADRWRRTVFMSVMGAPQRKSWRCRSCIWPILPEPFWDSIVKSMTKQFSNYLYIRTFWSTEQDSFSDDFNAFVQSDIIPKCPRFNEV